MTSKEESVAPVDRIEELERRVRVLEEAATARSEHRGTASPGEADADPSGAAHEDQPLWALERLRDLVPEGAVLYAGHCEIPHDGPVEWQYGRPTDYLMETEWDAAAEPLEALGHPVRLTLLHMILSGSNTTADLTAAEGLGTTGQIHHHLRSLKASGWLVSPRRGTWMVPVTRVIPLLAIITAVDHM